MLFHFVEEIILNAMFTLYIVNVYAPVYVKVYAPTLLFMLIKREANHIHTHI